MIFLKNRTNNQDRIFQYISVSIIPIFLLILFTFSGLEKSFEKIIYAGAVLTNPQIMLKQINDNEKSDSVNEMANSDNIKKDFKIKIFFGNHFLYVLFHVFDFLVINNVLVNSTTPCA